MLTLTELLNLDPIIPTLAYMVAIGLFTWAIVRTRYDAGE